MLSCILTYIYGLYMFSCMYQLLHSYKMEHTHPKKIQIAIGGIKESCSKQRNSTYKGPGVGTVTVLEDLISVPGAL